ncbi:MAG: SMC-Scp complex subunit ScpB [Schwartzia sp.]|nr:SMC-Scp complex subunit ScpB [Schwartzia sp. (in: firmicutes)]
MFLADLLGPLEAVLFASGDPVPEARLMEILRIDRETVAELLAAETDRLADSQSGLRLQQVAGGWQLVTRPEYYPYIEKMAQTADRRLSASAMETLSIIAYHQLAHGEPVTKQEIEHIRGVHVERVLSLLMARDLVAEMGRSKGLGRPILYGVTDTFLRCFGLKDLSELPQLPETELTGEMAEQLSLLESQPPEEADPEEP